MSALATAAGKSFNSRYSQYVGRHVITLASPHFDLMSRHHRNKHHWLYMLYTQELDFMF